jgi:uncharacterized YigZ family protein
MNPVTDTYKTIRTRSTGIFNDRKSRFIGIALRVHSEKEIKETIADIKKEYHDAVHHCYAWELFDGTSRHRFSDDGEPSGSAGLHIYNQLFYKNLANILIVVVRYYGGIKLGVPGLINAYRTAAAEALNNAEIIEMFLEKDMTAEFPYTMLPEINKIEKSYNLHRTSQKYSDVSCTMSWKAKLSSIDSCIERMNGMNGVKIFKQEKS